MPESPRQLGLRKKARRRNPVRLSQGGLVRSEPLFPDHDLPLLVEPATSGVDLASWAANHRSSLETWLRKHGGILFRGFSLSDVEEFESTIEAVSGGLLEYRERSSPRHAVAGNVYTSTDYPPDQPIFLHNENSYQNTWPMQIFFFCHVEPQTGGATPLCDVRKVYQRIDPAIRERFAAKKWCYLRNFGEGLGLPWQTVFQTEDQAQVEEYCRSNGIELEWREGDRLRTRSVRPAAVPHPETGDMVWFNHATFFHVSTLTASIREVLLSDFGEEDLPANSFYGDGTSIEPEVLESLRQAYAAETVRFPWRQGDLLMLDNMMVAHGREPFEGARVVLVGMAKPCSWETLDIS